MKLTPDMSTYHDVFLVYGSQKFDKHAEGILKGVISIQPQHTKIDISAR